MIKANNYKVKLIKAETLIYKMSFFAGNKEIFIKRDDLIDFGIGGNKVRKLEYIMDDVVNSGAEKVITFGSLYSNHIRITASVADYMGYDCDVIILTDKEADKDQIEGNILLSLFHNANIYYCAIEEAKGFIDKHLNNQEKEGINYFFIPGGGHSPKAALGYVDAAKEINKQLVEMNETGIDAVFLPTGTGTTQAGLIYGFKQLNVPTKVMGISVSRSKSRCIREIKETLDGINAINYTNYMFNDDDIWVMETNEPYGSLSEDVYDIIQAVFSSDGLILDPIYNAQAFKIMMKVLNEDTSNIYNKVLYINTGGLPNFFTNLLSKGIRNYGKCTDN